MRRASDPWDRFYHHHTAPWRGERDIRPWQSHLGEGPILELGCGNGKALRPLEALGLGVVGLDISWNALRRLGRGVLADAAALPFKDGAFSTVFDIHCSGHLRRERRARALHEARRVCRGAIIIERRHVDDVRQSQGTEVTGEPDMRQTQDGRETQASTPSALTDELIAAGWRPLTVDEHLRQTTWRGQPVTRGSVTAVARVD